MKIGLIFSGYNSQFVSMAKDFYDEYRIVQDYFEEAYNCLNINFVKLCFASSDQELSKVHNAYLAIFLVNSSLLAVLKDLGIQASIVTGYGLPGLYSAIYAGKGFTFPDGLYLLKKLTSFYDESLIEMNDIIVLKVEDITSLKLKKLCKDYNLHIVSYNSKNEFLVTGSKSDIENFKEEKNNFKFKFKVVNFEPGLYSDLVDNVQQQFKIYLEKVDFKDLQIPLISNIDAKQIVTSKKIKDNIVNQITKPINFDKVIEGFNDVDCIIEIGPKEIYSQQLKEIYPDKKIISFNKKTDIEAIKELLKPQEAIDINLEINILDINDDTNER